MEESRGQMWLEISGLAWIELEAGRGTGVGVVQRYVIVLFVNVGVDEGCTLLSGFFKDAIFSGCILACVSHLLLPSFVVAGFLNLAVRS